MWPEAGAVIEWSATANGAQPQSGLQLPAGCSRTAGCSCQRGAAAQWAEAASGVQLGSQICRCSLLYQLEACHGALDTEAEPLRHDLRPRREW